jgi:uncharacterized protein YdiU (UPF0061 family)
VLTAGRFALPFFGKYARNFLKGCRNPILPSLNVDQEQAVKLAQDAISDFNELYPRNWLAGMRAKLGIFNEEQQDEALIEGLLSLMQKDHSDYTNTFRALSFDKPEDPVMFGTSVV